MKLTKIKLINWHIFSNTSIELDGNTLITGENASGKSTLMDAIYYVLSGGDQNHFNKAANESGQRNLETYMRGKLGTVNNPYLRSQNDVVSYIILEFFDIKKNFNMVLGCELEIVSRTEPRTHFFAINNYKIKDDDFIKDKQIIEYRTLKLNCKNSNYDFFELSDTKKERRRQIAKDLFKLSDNKRYFDLLQNAISFKPISEVSTFVNGFLLEEDNIELDSLREEIRSYQNIHKLVIGEKQKIEMLKPFTPNAEKYIKNLLNIRYFNALKIDAKIEKLNNIINRSNIELKRLEDEYNGLKLLETDLRDKEARLKIEINQLENNEAYKALLNKKKQLETYSNDLSILNSKLNEFINMVSIEHKIVRKLGLSYRFEEDIKSKDFGILKAHLENYSDELKTIENNSINYKAKINYSLERNNELIKEKSQELDDLAKGLNNYPKDVLNLIEIAKNAIKEAYPKEQNPDVRPFCEYIEIADLSWTNALEGYLNTRRFNLIFDPKFYDCVSNAYNKYKAERNVYISGIVNAEAIPLIKCDKNSLVTKIDVKNKYAQKYANYLLGNLICVDDLCDLKKYESSITKEVMVYKNYVLKACNPLIYETPYIGADSRIKRINKLKQELNELNLLNQEYQAQINKYNEDIKCINESNIKELLKAENYGQQIDIKSKSIASLKEEIENDEKKEGLLEINGRIDSIRKALFDVSNKINSNESFKQNNSKKQGEVSNRLKDTSILLEEETSNLNNLMNHLDLDVYIEKRAEYSTNNRLNEDKIKNDFESAQKFNNAINSQLIMTMQKYTSTYKPSLVATIEHIKDYVNEYYDLINRGVVQYEIEAKEAYERAEISFREDFISKLKEKIEKSQKMLDKINKNLALHPFGNDEETYKFYYEPTKDSEFYNYYRIIMSDKLMNSKDLFTNILDPKDASFMKDLFDKISTERDDSKAIAEVDKYLDYRNYMNYDIKITNKYGDEAFFSKINREKSGGETQTPFYIVMASCFDELMNKDINKVESTCQVVFDEAFNNMDESRIKSLMEFYKKLNIQILIIVPSNRISAISPYMDTLIGITKVNNHPYVNVVSKE